MIWGELGVYIRLKLHDAIYAWALDKSIPFENKRGEDCGEHEARAASGPDKIDLVHVGPDILSQIRLRLSKYS